MQKMVVYILECSDKSYYTGVTNDLERRLWEHENGVSNKAFTFKRRPLKLIFYEYFPDANQAIAFEKQIKGCRREKKMSLINREWHKLPELSVNYKKMIVTKEEGDLAKFPEKSE